MGANLSFEKTAEWKMNWRARRSWKPSGAGGGGGGSVGPGRVACRGEKGGDPMYVLEVESSGLADELARGRRKA